MDSMVNYCILLAGSVLVLLGLWVAFCFTSQVVKFMIGRRTVSLQALLGGLIIVMVGLILVFVGVVI